MLQRFAVIIVKYLSQQQQQQQKCNIHSFVYCQLIRPRKYFALYRKEQQAAANYLTKPSKRRSIVELAATSASSSIGFFRQGSGKNKNKWHAVHTFCLFFPFALESCITLHVAGVALHWGIIAMAAIEPATVADSSAAAAYILAGFVIVILP